ncbi:MAG: hypothetical protein AABX50_02445 [Nanoarchaeota archaeon]
MDERIVWQPINLNRPWYHLGIVLNPDFAREMISLKIPLWVQERMNNLGRESLKKLGIDWDNPYQFYRDTSFVKNFRLESNGVWLGFSENLSKQSFNEPLIYHSQGINSLLRINGLLALVDLWADDCGPVLKGWSIIYNNP